MKKLLFILVGVIMLSTCKTEARHYYDLMVVDINQADYTERMPNADKSITVKTYYVRGGHIPLYSISEAFSRVVLENDATLVGFDSSPIILGGPGLPQNLKEYLDTIKLIEQQIESELQTAKTKVDTEREAYFPYPYKWYGFDAEFTFKLDRWYDVVITSSSRADKKVSVTSTSEPVCNCYFDYKLIDGVISNITYIPN